MAPLAPRFGNRDGVAGVPCFGMKRPISVAICGLVLVLMYASSASAALCVKWQAPPHAQAREKLLIGFRTFVPLDLWRVQTLERSWVSLPGEDRQCKE